MNGLIIRTSKKYSILLLLYALLIGCQPKTDWNNIALGEYLPEPKNNINIGSNLDDYLSVTISDSNGKYFEEYVQECIKKGYIVESSKKVSSFEAFNELGYELSIYKTNNDFRIHLRAPEIMSEIEWPKNGIGVVLPKTTSSLGKVITDSSTTYHVKISNMPIEEYNKYVQLCEDIGFNIDYSKQEKYYYAEHSKGYELSIRYIGANVIEITVEGKIAEKDLSSTSDNSTIENVNNDENANDNTLKKDEIRMEHYASYYHDKEFNDVISELKKLGFTNIKSKAIYDLGTGFWDSLSLNQVNKISINDNEDFDEGDVFKKDSKIVITYQDLEMNNPNIKYKKYTIKQLYEDLNDNAVRAKKVHTDEYVEVTGIITEITDSGITLYYNKYDDYYLDHVYCDLTTEKQKEYILELSKGETITLRGKIKYVDIIYPYGIDVYSFK